MSRLRPNGATRLRRMALPAVAIAIAAAVLAPLLAGGFVLSYDMVFTPQQPLVPASLGLGARLPRAVPGDAVIALATSVLPGEFVQKLVLFIALTAGPLGAGRLVPTDSLAVRVVAAVGYGWTPFVAERLFMGHWQLLLTYGFLPWIAVAGLAVRRGEPRALGKLMLVSAPAALHPTGGIIAALTALACAGRARSWPVGSLALLLNAPWWVPSVLHPAVTPAGGPLSDPGAVDAFAASSPNWAPAVVSVLGLGGFWNFEVVPASRAVPVIPLLVVAIVVIALCGQRELARRWGIAPARSLLLLGVFGVTVSVLGTLPLTSDLLRWLVAEVPGAGLLRDGQKWVALWALPLVLGFAVATEVAARTLRTPAARAATLTGAAIVPILAMPDLAAGGLGRLEPVRYPPDWSAVADILDESDRAGDVLALPMSAFRRFAWNDYRTQLDPAPRFLPRTTVIDDRVYVAGQPIAGENRRAAAVRAALAAGTARGEAGSLGIGWVLVEHGTPGEIEQALLERLVPVFDGRWLSLYRVPGEVAELERFGPPLIPVLIADGAAVAIIAGSALWVLLPVGRLWRRPKTARRAP